MTLSCGVSVAFVFTPEGERADEGFCPCVDYKACDHGDLAPIHGGLVDGVPQHLYDQCSTCGVLMGVNDGEQRCTCSHSLVLHDEVQS